MGLSSVVMIILGLIIGIRKAPGPYTGHRVVKLCPISGKRWPPVSLSLVMMTIQGFMMGIKKPLDFESGMERSN